MVRFSTKTVRAADDEDDEDGPLVSFPKRLKFQSPRSGEEEEGLEQQQWRKDAPRSKPVLPSADAAVVASGTGTDTKTSTSTSTSASIRSTDPATDPSSSSRRHDLSHAAFFDLDTLDCNICMEALSAPIYQCCNGHYSCVDCTIKMRHKCPTCSEPTGKIRNLGLEKVIESLRLRCKNYLHGCTQMLGHELKKSHEARCPFTPCNCPVVDCNFQGPSCDLVNHFCKDHYATIIRFSYGDCFLAAVHSEDRHVLLKADDQLFLLHAREEGFGKLVYLSAFGYPDLEEGCTYRMDVEVGTRCLSLSSTVQKHQQTKNNLNLVEFLVIPRSFYVSDRLLTLSLTINRPKKSFLSMIDTKV